MQVKWERRGKRAVREERSASKSEEGLVFR
jgi:hypothetical protein